MVSLMEAAKARHWVDLKGPMKVARNKPKMAQMKEAVTVPQI